MKRLVRIVKGLALLFAAGLVFCALLRWQGLLLFPQEAAPGAWEVFGVDVSSYQGEVDWPTLAEQGIRFAFCKATEGSGHVDPTFQQNWQNAREAGVLVGAYHFFSYDSPGETQAENFIAQVPVTAGALPPVVDVEFYGKHDRNPPSKEETWAILGPLLERLEEHYGVKPILYATYRSYKLYLVGETGDYPLWITRPIVGPMDKPWTFWQYSHSARLEGYVGKEERIDLDVFRGSLEELKGMTLPVGTKAPAETPPIPVETDQPTGEKAPTETQPIPVETGRPLEEDQEVPVYSNPITAFYGTLIFDGQKYGSTSFYEYLAENEADAWEREARNIFAYLKENAHPKLESSYLGLDLEQFEKDFFSYVKTQSYLDACVSYTGILKNESEPWGDFIPYGSGFGGGEMRARSMHYCYFVTQWYDALTWDRGKTALDFYTFSPEEELGRLTEGNGLEFAQGEYRLGDKEEPEREDLPENPIDGWVSQWLYWDGNTYALAADAYREMWIWRDELCHVYEVMAAHANPAAGLSDDIETAQEALIELGRSYGDAISLALYSNAFSGDDQEEDIFPGSIIKYAHWGSCAEYYRHETLRLWLRLLDRLDWDRPTWAFDPKEHERELDPSRNPDLTEWEGEKLRALKSGEDVFIWFDEERMYFEPLQHYTSYNLLKTPPEQVRAYARRRSGEESVEVFCQEDYGGPTTVRLKNGTEETQEISIEELEIKHGGIGELTMADVNFDGADDVLLSVGQDSQGGGHHYVAFLKEDEGGYRYEASFSEICTPQIDADHRVIWGGSDFSYGYYYDAFEFVDGAFVNTHSLVGDYPDLADWEKGAQCTEYMWVDGENAIVGQTFFPKQGVTEVVKEYIKNGAVWEGWAWCDPHLFEMKG